MYIYDLVCVVVVMSIVVLLASMRDRARQVRPSIVSPDVALRHSTLIYVIRGTGALIAGVAASAGIYFAIQCVVGGLRGEMGTLGWLGIFIAVLISAGFFGLISYVGYGMWLRVDSNVVANFSFVFAVTLAVVWYHLLPANLPKVVMNYFWDNPFFYPFRVPNPNPSYRALLSYLAFFIFYKLVKAYVLEKLSLKPAPLRNGPPEPPDEPSTPEFSQRSPLVEL